MAGKKAKKAEEPEVSREPIVTEASGWPRYECPICGRDSDSLSTITDHIDGAHPEDKPTEADTDEAAGEGDGDEKGVSDGES